MKRSSSSYSNNVLKPNKIEPGSYLKYSNSFLNKSKNGIPIRNIRECKNYRSRDRNKINDMLNKLKSEIVEISKNIKETDNKVEYYIKKHYSSDKKNNKRQEQDFYGLNENYSSKNIINNNFRKGFNEEEKKTNKNQFFNYQPNIYRKYNLRPQKLTYEYDSNYDYLNKNFEIGDYNQTKYDYFSKIMKDKNDLERKNYFNRTNYDSSFKNITPEKLNINNISNPQIRNYDNNNAFTYERSNYYNSKSPFLKKINNNITPDRITNQYSNNYYLLNNYTNNIPKKNYNDNSKSPFLRNLSSERNNIRLYNNDYIIENNTNPERFSSQNNYNIKSSNDDKNIHIKSTSSDIDFKRNNIPLDENELKYDRKSLNEINQKNFQIEKLNNENRNLKNENENLKMQIKNTIEELNKKEIINKENLEIINIKEENLKMRKKIDEMEKDKKEINDKIEKIKNDNNNLYEENQRLKLNNEDMNKSNDLNKNINQLKQNLIQKEKEIIESKKLFNELKNKYDKINEDNENLQKQRNSLIEEGLNLKAMIAKENKDSNKISFK